MKGAKSCGAKGAQALSQLLLCNAREPGRCKSKAGLDVVGRAQSPALW